MQSHKSSLGTIGQVAPSLRETGAMTSLVLQFALLAILIVAAGTMLACAADTIGRLTSLGGTLAGCFLLAAAMRLPELVIDYIAAMIEAADLALGDLLGSSLFNLLIMGMIDLTHRARLTAITTIGWPTVQSSATRFSSPMHGWLWPYH